MSYAGDVSPQQTWDSLASDPDAVLAAITDEPPGGSQVPTGAIHLSGPITPQK